jgi:transaldolase
MNDLEQLKPSTTVVADTGNFLQIAQFAPRDATTNASLILKAVLWPGCGPLLADTVAAHPGRPQDEAVDADLVRFGLEMPGLAPGRVGIEVDARLSFDTESTVGRGQRLISRFVGRVQDRHRKQARPAWHDAAMAGANDPGVKSVTPALSAGAARALPLSQVPAVPFDVKGFRCALKEEAMATEKPADGIRAIAADAARLDSLIEGACS